MAHAHGTCAGSRPAPVHGTINFPGTYEHGSNWKLYNHLIAQIPEGIVVRDYALGLHWSYVEADCGMGVAWTARGGAPRAYAGDLRGLELREVAELSKSWCFEEATLGIAALNAWFARPELLNPLGAEHDASASSGATGTDKARSVTTAAKRDGMANGSADNAPSPDAVGPRGGKPADAFELYRPRIEAAGGDANVVVVGHFPHVDRIAEYANLTVLERNCRDGLDTPDPACEYVLPQADYAFITGVTLINKTAPRLLDLARNATTVMVGPSVVMSPFLFDWGVELLAGSVVADPEATRFAVHNGAGKLFGRALRMTNLTRK